MEQEKSFTNPQLQLSELAKQLNHPSRKLSNLINEIGGINFNQFQVKAPKKVLIQLYFQ